MVTAPEDTMFESSSEDIPRSEEIFISQAAVKCENARYPIRIPGIFMVSRMMRDRSEGGLGGHREVRCPAELQSLREHFSASIASTFGIDRLEDAIRCQMGNESIKVIVKPGL